MDAQLIETGITHTRHKPECSHTHLIGCPVQLRQIMVNLLSNAIKYNRPDGRIDTYTEELSCENGTVWYEFTITDTGVGMSEAFVKNELFRPFTQEKSDARTQYKGTGLGDVYRQGAAGQTGRFHPGKQYSGQGTTFAFRLPFAVDTQDEETLEHISTDNPASWPVCRCFWSRTMRSIWRSLNSI